MKLGRKEFFKGIALGTLSLPFLIRGIMGKGEAQSKSASNNYISGKKYKWKMVTTWPPNFPVLGEACLLFAELVNKMSAGRMEIRVYGGGELVPPLEAFDTVRSGAAEIGNGAAYYWAGKVPAAQFFASVPFGMNGTQLRNWIISGGGMELWEELYAKFNLVPLSGGNTGVQMGGWFNKEINTIEDIKGLKMRIPGLGGKVLEKAGGAPVLLAGGEIYTGLERGVIDATEWLGPFHDYKMGFHQIAKYYYTPGWHEPGTELEFFINKEKFDELPEDMQAIIKSAGAHTNLWYSSEMETINAEYLEILKKEEIEIRTLPKEVLDKLRVYSKEVIDEITSSDPAAKKIYDSYSAFQKKAADWAEISDKAYYNTIQE